MKHFYRFQCRGVLLCSQRLNISNHSYKIIQSTYKKNTYLMVFKVHVLLEDEAPRHTSDPVSQRGAFGDLAAEQQVLAGGGLLYISCSEVNFIANFTHYRLIYVNARGYFLSIFLVPRLTSSLDSVIIIYGINVRERRTFHEQPIFRDLCDGDVIIESHLRYCFKGIWFSTKPLARL